MTSFRFLDDVDAQRQLGVDRLTFEELLHTKRLRPVSRQGTLSFYRAADIARLRAELYPETEAEDDEAAADATPPDDDQAQVIALPTDPSALPDAALASPPRQPQTASKVPPAHQEGPEGEAITPSPSLMGRGPGGGAKPKKKGHDPAMRVHLRLTADLKWYDITDPDLQAWFNQLHPETYARRRANAEFVKQRMEQIIALLDAGQARYEALVEQAADGDVQQTGGGVGEG